MLKASATGCQFINIGGLEVIRIITTHVANPEVVGKDEDDVGLGG